MWQGTKTLASSAASGSGSLCSWASENPYTAGLSALGVATAGGLATAWQKGWLTKSSIESATSRVKTEASDLERAVEEKASKVSNKVKKQVSKAANGFADTATNVADRLDDDTAASQ